MPRPPPPRLRRLARLRPPPLDAHYSGGLPLDAHYSGRLPLDAYETGRLPVETHGVDHRQSFSLSLSAMRKSG
ncbi:hypothetical protein EJB05_40425, partial [Eragrostis curvula]